MRIVLTIAVVLGGTALAWAQGATKAPTNEAMYISQAQLERIMQNAPPSKTTGKPGPFSSRLFEASTFSTAFIRLEAPDQPHAHGVWSEVFVVKEGSGIIETGGKITGKLSNDSVTHRAIFTDAGPADAATATRKPAPGDLSGTDVEGGHKQAVKPGDVILIPAGVSHRWFKVDQPIVYLDIKFPKAQ